MLGRARQSLLAAWSSGEKLWLHQQPPLFSLTFSICALTMQLKEDLHSQSSCLSVTSFVITGLCHNATFFFLFYFIGLLSCATYIQCGFSHLVNSREAFADTFLIGFARTLSGFQSNPTDSEDEPSLGHPCKFHLQRHLTKLKHPFQNAKSIQSISKNSQA